MLETHPNAHFDIAGDGPLKTEMEALAAQLGIAERVTFHGFCDMGAVVKLCKAAHFFVHPSQTAADGNREGVPNAMLEAMATGLPVLATTHGGIPEAVDDGTAGHLVAEGDADGLAQAALRAIAAPENYAVMSRAARASVDETFALAKNHRAAGGLLSGSDRSRQAQRQVARAKRSSPICLAAAGLPCCHTVQPKPQ